MRVLERVLAITLAGLGTLASCGTEFQSGGGAAGSGMAGDSEGADGGGGSGGTGSGGKGSGGKVSGGSPATGGSAATGGDPGSGQSGETTTGGMSDPGDAGSPGNPMGGSGDGGPCSELTALKLLDPGFESGALNNGWVGSGNFPQYASITTALPRTGSYAAELNDAGVGVPGIEQKLPVTAALFGKTVSVTAWVRLKTFPSFRLLLEANSEAGVHLGLDFSDTDPANPAWQQLSAALTIPANTDHVMIKILSAVADATGIAYADDVVLCMDGLCTPCAP